jgi:DNA-binding protein H-NS
MPKTFAQVSKQIEALRAEAEQLRKVEVAEVIEKINAAVAAYGLTAEDLFGRRPGQAGAAKKSGGNGRAPKYSDGNGNVWGGMGPRPKWLREALDAGKTLEDFMAGSGDAKPGSNGSSGGATAPARKAAAKGGRQSEAGATSSRRFSDGTRSWSGRGPQPGWVKEALAGGKTLDDLRVG